MTKRIIIEKQLITTVEADPAVEVINVNPLSMYMAPEEIILLLPTVFQPYLTMPQLTEAIDRIKNQIQNKFPSIIKIFITPISRHER